MSHTIIVTLNTATTPHTVSANPNPLPGDQPPIVEPGDTVIWILDETATGTELQPLFTNFQDLTTPGSMFKPSNPFGPFQSLEVIPGGIKGIVRPYVKDLSRKTRFFYKLVEKGEAPNWQPPIPGAPDPTVGGGIDIPTKPPT